MKQIKILALACVGLFLTSCNSDDDEPTPSVGFEEPATYSFTRDGNSTVSFDGQNTRILMANEITSELLDFENQSESKLLNMYNHQAGENNFENEDLNSSSKNIRSKVAASADYFATNSVVSSEIKKRFENILIEQVRIVKPNYQNMASSGVAGQLVFGDKTRYVSDKGLEYNQLFAKGLIGALIADQTLNNYLSKAVLDAGDNRKNNDEDIVEPGKPYTTMEHKWDEAYGYIYGGNVDNQADPNASAESHNSFLHGYIKAVDKNPNFTGIKDDIYQAFKKGRAAIVAKDYDTRDQQIKILKEKISTVIAVRGIYYFQHGKKEIEAGTRTAGFHALSEAIGFLYSMQFTRQPNTDSPYLERTEVLYAINKILEGNGLWDVDVNTLDEVSELMAKNFNFTVEQAK